MKKFVLLAIFILVIFSACRPKDNSYELNLGYAMAHANYRREIINPPTREHLLEVIAGRCSAPITIDLQELMTEPIPNFTISTEKAIYDVNLLFGLLRDMYGAYYYFGGDEVFLPLLDNIIEELNRWEHWSGSIFETLLINNLSTIIADNHFRFGQRTIEASASFFEPGLRFTRSDNGFRHLESGLYVTEVAGHNINDVFRLTIDEAGEFFYSIVIAIPNEGILHQRMRYNITIVLENDKEITKSLRSTQTQQIPFAEPSLWFEGDIPIVSIREMEQPNATDGLESNANKFLFFAEELADEPIIIIDVRSNRGGACVLSTMWLYRILGEVVPETFAKLFRHREIKLPEDYACMGCASGLDLTKYRPIELLSDSNYLTSGYLGKTIENNQLIILLVDRFSASASECFASRILSIENTLIVGQNTSGTIITNGGRLIYLPNSGIPVSFGNAQVIYPEGHFAEGIGIAPDIWVSGDALTAVLAMLGR